MTAMRLRHRSEWVAKILMLALMLMLGVTVQDRIHTFDLGAISNSGCKRALTFDSCSSFCFKAFDINYTHEARTCPIVLQFHFILNVAVGGTNGFIPDDCINGGAPKPWSNSDGWSKAMEKFYDDRTNWQTTWSGEDAALQVDYIRVYQFVGEDGKYFYHDVVDLVRNNTNQQFRDLLSLTSFISP